MIRIAAVLLLATFLGGCSAGRDATHVVRRGDTLHELGVRYGVPHEEIARANGIADPRRLLPGQTLRIPRARGTAAAASVRPPADLTDEKLLWPVRGGRVSSGFGPRDAAFHDGIDIVAPIGTPVLAAERGVVVYSGYRRGYGNVVVVRHRPGLSTLYAHNQSNRVRVGQAVRRGEVVALVGDSGRTTGPNLHFEVWFGDNVVDPLRFFAGQSPVVAGAEAP